MQLFKPLLSFLHRYRMGPNIVYDRAHQNMTDSNGAVLDPNFNGCQDRLSSQEQLPWNGNHQHQEFRNGSHLQESRTAGSPLYHQHFERLPAEEEQQKFLLNNGIQLADCHPDVRRKLNEMFFRGTDLRYSSEVSVRGATSLEEDESSQPHWGLEFSVVMRSIDLNDLYQSK